MVQRRLVTGAASISFKKMACGSGLETWLKQVTTFFSLWESYEFGHAIHVDLDINGLIDNGQFAKYLQHFDLGQRYLITSGEERVAW